MTIKEYIKLKEIISLTKDNEIELIKSLTSFLKLDLNASKTENDTKVYKFLNEIDDKTLINRFTYEGVEYGFIPNLSTITTGEWIDLETYMSSDETLNYALAVMYRPIKKQMRDMYTIEPYDDKYTNNLEKHAKKFDNIDYKVASGSVGFFLALGQVLLEIIPQYINRE